MMSLQQEIFPKHYSEGKAKLRLHTGRIKSKCFLQPRP